jgi:hypothetical protein
LFVLFVISFSLANHIPIHLQYYDWIDVTLPTYMLIFVCFLAGVVFTGCLGIVERFRMSRTISRLNKTVRELRREAKTGEPALIHEEPPQQGGAPLSPAP